MFQANEVANLVISLIAALIAYLLFRRERLPGLAAVYAALALIVSSNIFTVVEGVVWQAGFNFLEHLSYLLAGVFFLYGCRNLKGKSGE